MSLTNSIYGEKKETLQLRADATSLADLKAEMVRKKAEALQNKQKGNYRPEKKESDSKKTNIWSKSNTGLLARMHKDLENSKEEEQTWQKSKSIMERKARIYDSLKEGKGRSEIASNFLVEFDRKSDSSDSDSDDGRRRRDYDYPAGDDGEEWVEYTDSLGRTRTCMKKDLKRLKRKDRDVKRRESDDSGSDHDRDPSPRERSTPRDSDEEPDMLSEEMRRELMRQKWEKEEMENLEKDSLHYTDVRFDEARTHGAGFYAFSRDEQKRQKEQVTLKKLHEETDAARVEKERKAEKRKRDMADRIWKIKQKRREKMGLPPLQDEQPSKADPGSSEAHGNLNQSSSDFTKSVVEGLKMFRKTQEEDEKRKNEIKRRENLRDWDVGKEGLDDMKKEWKVLTQQEWMVKQRKERNPEFAPPSAFNEARNLLKKKEEDFIKSQEEKRQKKAHKFNPPLVKASSSKSRDSTSAEKFSLPSKNTAIKHHDNDTTRLENYPMAALDNQAGDSHIRFDPMAALDQATEVYPDIENTKRKKPDVPSGYSTAMRLDLHKKMQESDYLPLPGLNTKIINQLEQQDDESDNSEEDEEMRRGSRGGAEIAPPCTMEYFNNTSSAAGNRRGQGGGPSSSSNFSNMQDAFAQGLLAGKKKF